MRPTSSREASDQKPSAVEQCNSSISLRVGNSLIGRNEVHSLAPDPHHDDGVIVALGPDGVAFVRTPRKP